MLASNGSGALLSRRDRIYLFSLLIPFAVYNLILKGLLVFSRPQDLGFMGRLALMQSDLLFNLAYVLIWIGLFAVARTRLLRWIVVGVLHTVTIFIALVMLGAYQYFKATGLTLSSSDLLLGLSSSQGTGALIVSGLSMGLLVLLLAILIYGFVGPVLVAYVVSRWNGWSAGDAAERKLSWLQWMRAPGVILVAYVLFSFSFLPGVGSTGASKSFARNAFVNVLLTATTVAEGEELPVDLNPVNRPSEATLLPTSSSERRNVVVIVLESTRADANTPYNSDLQTTPFLNDLAQRSLLVEQAYAIVGHTHNALTAINCGVEPPLDQPGTDRLSQPGGVPFKCLPHLLQEQGYNSVYFMSHEKGFENSEQILKNLGYEDFYSIENMNTAGFEPTYYWGYEDEIMLEPSRAWLEQHRGTPFLATYLTSAPHHDYLAPQQRHGRVEFSKRDTFNRYLNSVRNQDFFLKSLFDQYKQLGLYENTVFIVLGDHGEGFGEHGIYGHNMIYEEGMRIPLLVHDPRQFPNGMRIEGPADQRDILPTIADLLGYEIQGGSYSGTSLLQPLPDERTLMLSCWSDKGCLASIVGTEKYIYHFGDKPEELFDLATDPGERINLAGQRSPKELSERRAQVLRWRASVQAMYGAVPDDGQR